MAGRRLVRVKRVSQRKGREGSSFMSPTEQVEVTDAWAALNGDEIIGTVDETDSVSGKTVDRKGLQAAIKMCLSGEADGIIVAKVDRFARTLVGGLTAIEKLRKAGKAFIAVKDGIDGENASTPTGRMLLGFLFLVAQWQLETLTEGWESVRHHHIASGVNANSDIYGYRKDGVIGPKGKLVGSRKLIPVPEEVPWVVAMFDKRAEGWSWRRIADWLNDHEAPKRTGSRWVTNNVRRIVQRRIYLGEISSGDIVNTEAHDPIVSVKLWNQANALNRTAQRRDKSDFSLTGLIRCAGCGVRMVGSNKNNKYGTWRYYKCRRHFTFGSCEAPASIRADEIEAQVEDIFRTKFLNPCCDRQAQGDVSTEALEAAVADLEAAEADLEDFLVSDATIELGRRMGKLWVEKGQLARLDRVDAARAAVAEARNAVLGVSLPVDLGELWEDLGAEERRAFLADAFEIIAVRRGGGVKIWTVNDTDIPTDLPGRDGTSTLTPISVDDAPAGAGEAAA